MSNDKKVPLVVIRRLPRYYRYLTELLENGETRVSSMKLSKMMNCTASQIRQDFNYFGEFGQQGYGYYIEVLAERIGELLGLNEGRKIIIIGAGNLGRALANYDGFKKRGFVVAGIFDKDPKLVGKAFKHLTVQSVDDLEDFCKKSSPVLAALAIPKAFSQSMAERLVKCDVKGIWNFSHNEINVPVPVENVHLGDSLMVLSFRASEENQ